MNCSRCSVARPLPDEYAGSVVGPGQASHRQRSIDLEILPACTLEVYILLFHDLCNG
jgi:hypothetical protein